MEFIKIITIIALYEYAAHLLRPIVGRVGMLAAECLKRSYQDVEE